MPQVVLNGVGPNGEFNSFVSPNDDASYGAVSPGHLKGVSKLISGATNCNVRDMGGFTEGAAVPFGVRISMPDVLALMRQSWVYDRFCQTKCGTMTVVVLRSQHSRGKDKLRVAWENSGSLDYTKAQVCVCAGVFLLLASTALPGWPMKRRRSHNMILRPWCVCVHACVRLYVTFSVT